MKGGGHVVETLLGQGHERVTVLVTVPRLMEAGLAHPLQDSCLETPQMRQRFESTGVDPRRVRDGDQLWALCSHGQDTAVAVCRHLLATCHPVGIARSTVGPSTIGGR
jgi:hypothetical protein